MFQLYALRCRWRGRRRRNEQRKAASERPERPAPPRCRVARASLSWFARPEFAPKVPESLAEAVLGLTGLLG